MGHDNAVVAPSSESSLEDRRDQLRRSLLEGVSNAADREAILLDALLSRDSTTTTATAATTAQQDTIDRLTAKLKSCHNLLQLRNISSARDEVKSDDSEDEDVKQPSPQLATQLWMHPTINALFRAMRLKIDEQAARITYLEDHLDAIQFTPQSTVGIRLIAKIQRLMQENEALGKQLSQGRIEQLEAEREALWSCNVALQERLKETVDILNNTDN
ncbi:hypothetical protein GQ42DRAFT_160904 [Ramicandelaber brevisporus]|nr:hypothetical protein GQ42DRAFT_160904 [Ramicandelaber brevisporus]